MDDAVLIALRKRIHALNHVYFQLVPYRENINTISQEYGIT